MRKLLVPLIGMVLAMVLTIVVLTTGTVKAAAKKSARAEKNTASETTMASDPNTVWVAKHDQGKSCEAGSGVDMDAMGALLKKKNIRVLEKRKVHDGMMRIQPCGVDNGNMNGFLIPREDLPKAIELDFKPLPQS